MKTSHLLHFSLVLIMALSFQPRGQAQGNLVNLYNWSNQSLDHNGLEQSIASIGSSTSVSFYSGFTPYAISNRLDNPSPTLGLLTGILDTTPGATYEITFTTEGFAYWGAAYVNPSSQIMSFGNFSTNGSPTYDFTTQSYGPNNFDYVVVATSPTTTMSFNYVTVPGLGGILLSDFSVVEVVPEMTTSRLMCFGGCVLALAQQWRRSFKKRELN